MRCIDPHAVVGGGTQVQKGHYVVHGGGDQISMTALWMVNKESTSPLGTSILQVATPLTGNVDSFIGIVPV